MVSPYRPCCSAASEANPDALVHLAESGVRAYLTVMDRYPEAVEKALMNKPSHVSSNFPKKFTRS